MDDNNINCSGSYVLPTGPIGDIGPDGPSGPQPTLPPAGPAGDTGFPGRSKIDILFKGGKIGTKTVTYSNTIRHTFLGSFIYPGNTALGGDPKDFKVLYEHDSNLRSLASLDGCYFSLVELTSHDPSLTADALAATAILTTTLFNAVASESMPRIYSFTDSPITFLPDTEALIGIYFYMPVSTVTNIGLQFSFYSAELY